VLKVGIRIHYASGNRNGKWNVGARSPEIPEITAAPTLGSAMSIRISALDHVVLNVSNVETSAVWYQQVLGMRRKDFEPAPGRPVRVSLSFGNQKINLRRIPADDRGQIALKGALCFLTETAPADVVAHLKACSVAIEEGPVEKHGAVGMLISVYCRDPDGRLIEISAYED